MLEFKIDIMKELKKKGWNSPKIRESKLIGQKTLSDIKKGIVPGIKTIENLCYMLNMQPGSIIKYVPDPTGSEPGPEKPGAPGHGKLDTGNSTPQ